MLDSRRREIRKEADSFREKCKISRYGIIDLFKDCEAMGYKLFRYPLEESQDLGFVLIKDKDTIIFTNTCSRLSREIFTLAHEIGHTKLHMNGINSFVDNNSTISEWDKDDEEHEANYFAACLLMPDDEVDRFIDRELPIEHKEFSALDIARIMSEFNVSYDMTLNRLETLGKIDTNEKVRLETEKAINSVSKLLLAIGGNQNLNTITKEKHIPYEYLEYAIYNYNHNAIPKENLEKVLSYYNLNCDDIHERLIEIQTSDDDLDALIGGLED